MDVATGIKTLDRLGKIPRINSALSRVIIAYKTVKGNNFVFWVYLNMTELSIQAVYVVAKPYCSYFENPITPSIIFIF